MRYLIISIRDRAVEAFQPVANVRAEGEALRVFKDLISNPQTQHHQHADDYELYLVGYFDDQLGTIDTPPTGPRRLADGKTMREMLQAEGNN